MMHVKQIKQLIEEGQNHNAQSHIEDLLALGPQNVEALKLKAYLIEGEGHFQEAARVWLKILEIDNEDEDALDYLQTRQIEEKERFYFTDELPDGGRRFLAYPRALITISMWGLLGCLFFLFAIRFAEYKQIAYSTSVLIAGFFLFIVSPWVAIAAVYIRSLASLTLNKQGIEVATRFKSYSFQWADIEKITLAHRIDLKESILKLIIMPKKHTERPIVIDLSEESTPLKARSTITTEITKFFRAITYEHLNEFDFKDRAPRNF
jgi:tetratricopeptide (TPR) repeat protein